MNRYCRRYPAFSRQGCFLRGKTKAPFIYVYLFYRISYSLCFEGQILYCVQKLIEKSALLPHNFRSIPWLFYVLYTLRGYGRKLTAADFFAGMIKRSTRIKFQTAVCCLALFRFALDFLLSKSTSAIHDIRGNRLSNHYTFDQASVASIICMYTCSS